MANAVSLSEMSSTWICGKSEAATGAQNEGALRPISAIRKASASKKGPARQDLPCGRTATVTAARVAQGTKRPDKKHRLPAFLPHHR